MHIHVLTHVCCVESLSRFRSTLDFLQIFEVAPKSDQSPCAMIQGLGQIS